jgi:pimeloyl-ACP methyl ester carboxylesterase
VILLHGFGGSTFSWRLTLPALADAGYSAVALDLRGFGLSDKDGGADHGHAAQARYVAALMDELAIQDAVVVGHSMGGNVAAHLAVHAPPDLRRRLHLSARDHAGARDERGAYGTRAKSATLC